MPSALYNQCILNWIDKNGQEAQNFWTTLNQSSGGASAYEDLAEKAEAISCCKVQAIQFQTTLVRGATPVTGPYQTVLDRANILAKISGTNVTTTISLPGPQAAIFLPGNVIVDMSNTDVIAFQAALAAVIGDTSGNPIGVFKRGYRTSAKVTL
jgi:hypothetical protein